MRARIQLVLWAFIALIATDKELTNANVLFRWALNFRVGSGNSSENIANINHALIFENDYKKDKSAEEENTGRLDELTLAQTTTGPSTSISYFLGQEQSLNGETDAKLKEIVEGLTKFNQELSPVLGRSDFLVSKMELVTRYLNILDASAARATPSDNNKFEYLQKFIKLVDKLKEPPRATDSKERMIEYMLMKLTLEKYRITKLQAEVEEQVAAALLAWQQYVKTKLVEVTVNESTTT